MNARPKVVIIDDVPENILRLHKILDEDYDVFFGTSGEKGLGIVDEQLPDVILLDVLMPGMDGYEVCSRIKAAPRTAAIPIIFVTTAGQTEDEAKGLALGAIDYLVKPISPAIVKARVRNHVALKRSRDILERLSTTDGLTGIANRRRFDEYLDFQWRQSSRSGTPLSLLLTDIDYFKNFNDHYGHIQGDSCLKQVAGAIAGVVARSSDLVARYGGEEFVCLLPGTNSAGAQVIADRLLNLVRALAIPHAFSQAADHVTVSVGLTTQIPTAKGSPLHLLEAADQALYHAKNTGRNQLALNNS
ncbi:two-component system, chemotaxis family, response regulator WspR [Gammaproteobacteria bacterium]